jgi:hypothetical protein
VSRPRDVCGGRAPWRERAGASPLAEDTEDPVLCADCGALFGRGAEARTSCPYCAGSLHPLPAARAVLRPGGDGPVGAAA